ncbi:hypothetical protein D8815_08480 [Streptococcus gordonii]|nr:hypothetical protein D8815_08480 [Streptococcus gordonii]DAJ35550.1 MAG TPA: hypothetical protein [Caudoviricetes sp.]RSJ49687.1 hypothetical protein D8816_00985 [Streptococcus gordonii]RSJ60196.1 hypothetical protein D8810_10070 [Streptococcus gordonii]DAO48326.1 MAG TPA: hypothetical protein [Caudoviricetes sp.]
MTVEHFLKSLSELLWTSYWTVIIYMLLKNNKD